MGLALAQGSMSPARGTAGREEARDLRDGHVQAGLRTLIADLVDAASDIIGI